MSVMGVTAPRADDKALGMECMCACARTRLRTHSARTRCRSGAQSGLWSVHPLRGQGERRWGRGLVQFVVVLGAAHAAQVVAPRPDFALRGLDERGQPRALRADPLLPARPAIAAAAVCVGCGRFLPPTCAWCRRRGESVLGARSCASGPGRRRVRVWVVPVPSHVVHA